MLIQGDNLEALKALLPFHAGRVKCIYIDPPLNKVIEGEQGGISKSVGWQGGGGFRFYRLGPPAFDADGRIRSDIRFPVLAAHLWFSETGRALDRTGGTLAPPRRA